MSREIAPRKENQGDWWKTKIAAWMPSIRNLLPKEISPDRMARLVLVTFQKNPALMQCTEASVYASIMEAVKLGLEIDCVGQAWLIPYKNQCQLLIGYQGLLQLIYNSGMVSFAKAEVVYSNDTFEYEETSGGTVMRHVPHWMREPGSKGGDLMAVYAQITLPGGEHVCQVYGRPTVERHRASSSAFNLGKKDSPWFTHEEEMWKKTALRAISKLLPKSTTGAKAKVMAAVELDEKGDRGEQFSIDADFSIAPPDQAATAAVAPAVEKPAASEGDPDGVCSAKEIEKLWALAHTKHGTLAHDVVRATLKAHEIKVAAKIPRRLYAQVWTEVEAGTHLPKPAPQEAEDQPDPGPGDDPTDQGQFEGLG